jgi:hypothetical protein
MELNNMSDIWRIKNPNTRKYTWTSNTKPEIMCRLDFFLMSDSLQGQYNEADIIPGYMSDHSCTTLVLNTPDPDRGKGFWKYNSTLAENKDFKNQIRNTVHETIQDNEGTDECLLWDVLKCQIRGTCIGFAAKKNKERRDHLLTIEKELKILEEERIQQIITNDKSSDELENHIEEKMMERDSLIDYKIKGEEIRSRLLYHEEGDRPSKMFLNLEKSRGEAKNIKKLKSEDGKEEFTTRKGILKEQQRFYNALYKSQLNTSSHQLRTAEHDIWNTEGKKINNDDKEKLTEIIQEDELWEVIKSSPLNKSPGSDGLTTEFYKDNWLIIKKYLINSLNHSLERGKLNISQRRGIITLIPKPQKDLEYLKNWRPITLLNQDYKYLTKILANRLEKTMKPIISNDQSGFVKGRYIGCNIQRIQNMVEMCNENNTKGWIINIDFEKAFDTIEWSFIYKTLEKMDYPTKFIEWIKTLYNDIETCVINNGHTTEFFKPERGVRQGCPISPYLFILTTEIMNRWLQKNISKYGIKDKKKNNYLISQFADDTSFSLTENKEGIHSLFKLLNTYGEVSGLKLNINKTEIMLLKKTDDSGMPKRYKKYIKKEVKYLGCQLSIDQQETTKTNIYNATTKINNLIDKWMNRRTTLSGKIAIIKSLLIPQLTYTLTTMASPDEKTIKDINQNFLNS